MQPTASILQDVRRLVADNLRTPVDILIELAEDNHETVREGVARNSNTPPEVLTRLAGDEDEDVRAAAIWSLAQIGGENVRPTLESLLENTDDDDEASFIEEALEILDFTEEMSDFDLLEIGPDDEDQYIIEPDPRQTLVRVRKPQGVEAPEIREDKDGAAKPGKAAVKNPKRLKRK